MNPTPSASDPKNVRRKQTLQTLDQLQKDVACAHIPNSEFYDAQKIKKLAYLHVVQKFLLDELVKERKDEYQSQVSEYEVKTKKQKT